MSSFDALVRSVEIELISYKTLPVPLWLVAVAAVLILFVGLCIGGVLVAGLLYMNPYHSKNQSVRNEQKCDSESINTDNSINVDCTGASVCCKRSDRRADASDECSLTCFALIAHWSWGLLSKLLFAGPREPVSTSAQAVVDEPILRSKPAKVPHHIAVIMDGNRRFGRRQHSDPLQGHWAGGQTLIDFVQWCMIDGVRVLTVYAFSTENWQREANEVGTLMNIFAKYADSFRKEALAKNVKVNVLVTDDGKLPPRVKSAIDELQNATNLCTGFTVNICLSYGSRGEITQACASIGKSLVSGELDVRDVTEDLISKHLTTKDYPDPDILIRTSGELRLSNFMLWQLAYSELFFIDKLWPEVTQTDLRNILHQFSNSRDRRYGK